MSTAARPDVEIAGCVRAHAVLLAAVAGIDEVTLALPSRLPQWSVAHVLGHLVGNARSVVRRLRGVVEDRLVDQYPGGEAGRAAQIEELAGLPAAALLDALQSSCDEVDAAFSAVPDDAWGRESRAVDGTLHPAYRLAFSRWREVEVHHADLGLGFEPADWSPALVERWLPRLLEGLPRRTGPADLAAWLCGRGGPPTLTPWG